MSFIDVYVIRHGFALRVGKGMVRLYLRGRVYSGELYRHTVGS